MAVRRPALGAGTATLISDPRRCNSQSRAPGCARARRGL